MGEGGNGDEEEVHGIGRKGERIGEVEEGKVVEGEAEGEGD